MVFENVRWTYSEVQLWGRLAHWQILISVLDVISWSPNSTDLYFWYVFVKRQIQKTWQGNLLGYHWLVCIAVLIRLWAVACYFNPSQDLFPSRSTTIYGGATSAAQKIKVRDYSPPRFCGIALAQFVQRMGRRRGSRIDTIIILSQTEPSSCVVKTTTIQVLGLCRHRMIEDIIPCSVYSNISYEGWFMRPYR